VGVGVPPDSWHNREDGLGCKDKVGEWVVRKGGQVTRVVGHMKETSRGKERTPRQHQN